MLAVWEACLFNNMKSSRLFLPILNMCLSGNVSLKENLVTKSFFPLFIKLKKKSPEIQERSARSSKWKWQWKGACRSSSGQRLLWPAALTAVAVCTVARKRGKDGIHTLQVSVSQCLTPWKLGKGYQILSSSVLMTHHIVTELHVQGTALGRMSRSSPPFQMGKEVIRNQRVCAEIKCEGDGTQQEGANFSWASQGATRGIWTEPEGRGIRLFQWKIQGSIWRQEEQGGWRPEG